jgi:hypothetical protein
MTHPDLNVAMLSTGRDKIIQDFSGATTLRLITQINTSYLGTDFI